MTNDSQPTPEQGLDIKVILALRDAGYADPVKLPEPTDTYNHLTETSMMGWEVGHGPAFVEVLTGHPAIVRVEGDGEPAVEVSPAYARELAAAILAAADAAERGVR